jgi:hypothetical protein
MDSYTIQTFDGQGNLVEEEVIPLSPEAIQEEKIQEHLQRLWDKDSSRWTLRDVAEAVKGILVLLRLGGPLSDSEE